jgi:hypothetical protein
MNIVFFAVGDEHAAMAELAAEAARITNPAADLYVLTDIHTQFRTLTPVRGHCSKETLMYDRTIAQYHFLRDRREAIFLDSDCVVQRDLTGAFAGPVAVTERIPPKNAAGQIYNGGVLYGSGHAGVAFWLSWCELYWLIQRDAWAWYGDQVLLAKLVPNYTSTQVYPSHTHNLVLSSAVEIDAHPDAYIVHYKGKRKHWMRDHVEAIKQMKVAA